MKSSIEKWLGTKFRDIRHYRQNRLRLARGFDPLITISISKNALLHNVREFRSRPIAPVLKSNAYGHGMVLVAQILEKEAERDKTRQGKTSQKIASFPSFPFYPFFVVDSYFEARALRYAGVITPLLIIGYSTAETVTGNRLENVYFTATSVETLKRFENKIHRPTIIHLKIDTGMRRQGIMPHEIDEALRIIRRNPNIILDGIATHFAEADNADVTFTDRQIALWNAAVKKVRNQFPSLRYWHAENTAGYDHASHTDHTDFAKKIEANVSRIGIGLYGITPTIDTPRRGDGDSLLKLKLKLKPILEMTSVISGIKNIKKGDSVGYSRTFIAPRDMVIATIPVGYFEGIDRRLSNKGFVKIEGGGVGADAGGGVGAGDGTGESVFAPIIGRVSMNITTIDVTQVVERQANSTAFTGFGEGYPVTIISATPEDANSVENIATQCDTIPYEILAHIAGHLRRRVE